MKRLDRYILQAVVTPLMMMMGIAVLLLLLDQMLRLFQFVLEQNGSVGLVWRMLGTLLPEYVSLALPIGFFLGALFATRGFSLSSELDSCLAAGMPLRRMLWPVLLLAMGLCLFNLLITGFLQPVTSYSYSRLRFEVRTSLLTAQVRDGAVIKLGEGITLRVGAAVDGDRPWRNIFLERCERNGDCTAVLANSGRLLESSNNDGQLVLRLFDGRQVSVKASGPVPGYLGFDVGDFSLDQVAPEAFRRRGGDRKEVTLIEMIRQLSGPLPLARRHELEASFHWRLLHSLLILALPFLGMGMGMADKRSDRGFGFVFGIVMVIVYYRLLQAAESSVAAGQASPWISMWPIFGAYFLISVTLFALCSEIVGFRPFGWLERGIDALRDAFPARRAKRKEARA